jgi:UDP-N-acetylglucosamine--N-acetylmuramyl-(pentapeptide) pyrophosphoryl-undecaprenol N-acetylglucosamine transferase
VLNETVPRAIALLTANQRPEVWHQAGAATLEIAERAYRDADVAGRVDAFLDDMAAAYSWADVVICRAGALTVAELAAAGLPAVLVPFPGAVDDHQTRNAEYLVAAGAAVLIAQADLTPARLAEEISRAQSDRSLVLARASRARALARPRATQELAELCLALGKAA